MVKVLYTISTFQNCCNIYYSCTGSCCANFGLILTSLSCVPILKLITKNDNSKVNTKISSQIGPSIKATKHILIFSTQHTCNDDMKTWIKKCSDLVLELISQTPPDGELFLRTVKVCHHTIISILYLHLSGDIEPESDLVSIQI